MSRYRMTPEWADYGVRWGNDGRLYLAEWRRGFSVHELRALFFECQQIRSLTRERDTARIELETATAMISQLEVQVAWYRRQVTAEARLYPLLSPSSQTPETYHCKQRSQPQRHTHRSNFT